jgi:hypothetical protein
VARAAVSTPMLPLAPPRLSMMTCWPSAAPSFGVSSRAALSVELPAGNGTMNRSGLVGHVVSAALTLIAASAAHIATILRIIMRARAPSPQ